MNDLTIEEVFEAYFECRKTKRYSSGALSFESNYEENLIQLYNELKNSSWEPGRSTCFIITKPVRREVFAAPFKDRIVHHILIRRLESTFEKYFIKDSYACRKGKGTQAAINRVSHFIKSETKNNTQNAYILKLDIKGFFMSINRGILYTRLVEFLDNNYKPAVNNKDLSFEKELCYKIIYNDPCKNVILQSPKSAWKELPKDKSLFTAKQGCGLPIGNLTSQVFANFYLSELDHYIKHVLKVKCYVRYVDDCVFVHKDKNYLQFLIPEIRKFLENNLKVTLHPKKIYLQEASKGVLFLGAFIKPFYITSSKRVKNNFCTAVKAYFEIAENHKPDTNEKFIVQQSINSYLGLIVHYKTFKFRKKQLDFLVNSFWKRYLKLNTKYSKTVISCSSSINKKV